MQAIYPSRKCKALIEILELRNKLSDMQQEAIYFRGCYDSVGYLKKSRNFYNELTEKKRRWREC